jgi:hypothetical protein
MSGGVFAVDRRVFEHRIFADEPYTERLAWIWLLSEAGWKPKRVRTPHGMIDIGRGQLAHSQRFLAEKWRWDRSRVRRFLDLLECEKMVRIERPSFDPAKGPASTQQKAQPTAVLTICNYDKYQFGSPEVDPAEDAKTTQRTDGKRPKEEEVINKKKEIIDGAPAPRVASPAGMVTEPDVYRLGRDVLGKNCGGVITNLRKHCRQDLREVWDLLEQARDKGNSMEWVQGVLRGTESAKLPLHQIFPEEVYRNVL